MTQCNNCLNVLIIIMVAHVYTDNCLPLHFQPYMNKKMPKIKTDPNWRKMNIDKTSKTKVVLEAQWEYVQRHVCFVNIQSSLHENVVFFVCACLGNTAHIIFIMLNSISGLDAWYHFRFNISCGVAVMVRGHQKKFR